MWLLGFSVMSVLVNPTFRLSRSTRCDRVPCMVIDQLKATVKDMKGQAAAAIVQQKVAEKLARAREKYTIPDKYVDVMGGFFTSYMTEVYKAGLDMDKYEATLTTLFSKVPSPTSVCVEAISSSEGLAIDE